MEKYSIDLTASAEDDLRNIARYISSQFSAPTSVMNLVAAIKKEILNLADMPRKYPLISDERLRSRGYRKFVVKKYLVFYVIEEKNKIVRIDRILYAGRDWMKIL